MNTTHRQQKGILRETLSAVLLLALLAPGLCAKEQRGHDVVVVKKDGTAVQGELLAVKGTDLLVMEGTQGVTVGLAEVRTVKVIKTSKFLKGMGTGFLYGGIAGVTIGALAYDPSQRGWFFMPDTRGQSALWGGVSLGIFGALFGGVVGALSGIDKTVTMGDSSAPALSKVASELRRYARDRG